MYVRACVRACDVCNVLKRVSDVVRFHLRHTAVIQMHIWLVTSSHSVPVCPGGLLKPGPSPLPAGGAEEEHARQDPGHTAVVASPHQLATPTITLVNARSLDNKPDCVHLLRTSSETVKMRFCFCGKIAQ